MFCRFREDLGEKAELLSRVADAHLVLQPTPAIRHVLTACLIPHRYRSGYFCTGGPSMTMFGQSSESPNCGHVAVCLKHLDILFPRPQCSTITRTAMSPDILVAYYKVLHTSACASCHDKVITPAHSPYPLLTHCAYISLETWSTTCQCATSHSWAAVCRRRT